MDMHEDELDVIIVKALKSPDAEFSACHQLLGDLMEWLDLFLLTPSSLSTVSFLQNDGGRKNAQLCVLKRQFFERYYIEDYSHGGWNTSLT